MAESMTLYHRALRDCDRPNVAMVESEVAGHTIKTKDLPWCKEQKGFIAWVNGEVAGYVSVVDWKTYIEVKRIAVVNRCRLLGVGTRLMMNVVSAATAQDAKRVQVMVPVEELEAQLFFSRLGFLATNETETCYDFTLELRGHG